MWAASGAKGVVLVGRSAQKLEAAAANIPGELLVVAADVSNETEVKHVFEKTVARYGGVDVVVNTAGSMTMGPIASTSPSQWWTDLVSLTLTSSSQVWCKKRMLIR
jgi:NADP-dependent 3-hydroxy acid dehydrogenase YdfG